MREFYLGGARGNRYPDAEILVEVPHKQGGHLLLLECDRSYEPYRIAWRRSRREYSVDVISYHDPFDMDCWGWKTQIPVYHKTVDATYKSEETARAALPAFQTLFTPPKPTKRLKPRDSQREKAYEWEHTLVAKMSADMVRSVDHDTAVRVIDSFKPLSHEEAISLTEQYLKAFSVKMEHTIRFRAMKTCGGMVSGLKNITYDRNPLQTSVLHECAHVVVNDRSWSKSNREKYGVDWINIAAHGPEFCGVLIAMYERLFGFDRPEMERLAHQRGVAFNYKLVPEILDKTE